MLRWIAEHLAGSLKNITLFSILSQFQFHSLAENFSGNHKTIMIARKLAVKLTLIDGTMSMLKVLLRVSGTS